jgi:hypothetical protein
LIFGGLARTQEPPACLRKPGSLESKPNGC